MPEEAGRTRVDATGGVMESRDAQHMQMTVSLGMRARFFFPRFGVTQGFGTDLDWGLPGGIHV